MEIIERIAEINGKRVGIRFKREDLEIFENYLESLGDLAENLKVEEGNFVEYGENFRDLSEYMGLIFIFEKNKDYYIPFPIYKEELGFARRMGASKLLGFLKYLTDEERDILSKDRYNIVVDEDERKKCL